MIAVVTGMIATYPLGGVVWDYGQYVLGLHRLGWEVYYLEDTGWMTYDPRLREYVENPEFGVAFLHDALTSLAGPMRRRWHFRAMDGRTFGMEADDFNEVVSRADLLLNVSGGTLLRDEYMQCRCKVMIDTDPGWNHFRNFPRLDSEPRWGGGNGYRAHDFFFTYAERIGAADCVLPSCGIDWLPTRPPVVLDQWCGEAGGDRWTTVLTWKNFSEAIEYQGVRYGTKEIEFERVERLPQAVAASLEIAAGGIDWNDTSDHSIQARWRSLGWSVVDSHGVSQTAMAYRDYIQRSRGEFSVAKNVYVATRSGWFSCRSVCYLAAGLPVVVQDTGFSEIIPCGEGLMTFSSLEEAADAIARVDHDYARHQAAARQMAAKHFSADVVLGDLLRRIGLPAN
ncbi:glycosyltransferase family protein [Piscinibacter sakaiensis]|uniref:glycosyltransferase family protein n=1 Tax=Piscinibacter sakaiensis TaxID=1547922 RepID=UPI003AAA4EBF